MPVALPATAQAATVAVPVTTASGRSRSGSESSPVGAAARPRLLFFHRYTDGRSRRVDGLLAHVLQERRNHESFVLHRIDVDARPDLAERMHVRLLPTLLVVQDHRVALRITQPRSAKQIRAGLERWLRRPQG